MVICGSLTDLLSICRRWRYFSIKFYDSMASMLSEPFRTTSFASRQNASDFGKYFDDRDMKASHAAHVSVITSTNSMTTVNSLDSSNNNINSENAHREQADQKDGSSK